MLTKEEREAIAKRLHECDYLYDNALYQILFGHNVPGDTTFEDDSKAILKRLTDLIDPTCHDFGGEEGTNGENYDFACSACGWCGDMTKPNYCPNCGARVVRDEA